MEVRLLYFPTKKDIWFYLIIWGLVIFMMLFYIFGGKPVGWQLITYNSIPGYIISVLILTLLLWIWFGTSYKIEREFLKLKYGPFKSKIKIDEITKIRRTKSILTAPSLSVDRLAIHYSNYAVINISPKNESEFAYMLLGVNLSIQLEGVSLD